MVWQSLIVHLFLIAFVLWRCWLGGRKGIRPVKNWVVGCWRGCLGWDADLHIAQLMPLPLTISSSSKSRLALTFLVLPFWYLLTQVVPDIFQKSSKTVMYVGNSFYCTALNICLFADDPKLYTHIKYEQDELVYKKYWQILLTGLTNGSWSWMHPNVKLSFNHHKYTSSSVPTKYRTNSTELEKVEKSEGLWLESLE